MRDPHDVCIPRTQMLSLIATGTPASGIPEKAGAWPEGLDRELIDVSIAAARFNAPSRSISRKALSVSFNFSAALSADSVSLRAEVAPRTMLSLNSDIEFMLKFGSKLALAQDFRYPKVT